MIEVKRDAILLVLESLEIDNQGFKVDLMRDVRRPQPEFAVKFLVRKGYLRFPNEVLKKEVDEMVEDSLLTIEQWEQMTNILHNSHNGNQRIATFLRNKNRFVVID